jgi:glycosyl transferase family 25
MDAPHKLLKTYVITLPEATARRRFMEAQLTHFPFMDVEFVTGVRGADLSSEETDRVVNHEQCRRTIGHTLSPGEVGSTLSHLEVMQRMEREKQPYALILEDDPIISGMFSRIVWQISAAFQPDRPKIILLTPCKYFKAKGHTIKEDFAIRPFFDGFYAGGYMINLEAARILPRALLPLRAHLDWWKVTQQVSGVEIDALVPYCVGISISENTASFINPGTSGGMPHRATQSPEKQTAIAACLKFGNRVRRGILERALGIRGQRLVF